MRRLIPQFSKNSCCHLRRIHPTRVQLMHNSNCWERMQRPVPIMQSFLDCTPPPPSRPNVLGWPQNQKRETGEHRDNNKNKQTNKKRNKQTVVGGNSWLICGEAFFSEKYGHMPRAGNSTVLGPTPHLEPAGRGHQPIPAMLCRLRVRHFVRHFRPSHLRETGAHPEPIPQ